MPGAEGIKISLEADQDLKAIGGDTEKMLIGEIFLLPDVPESACPELPWQEGGLRRRRWEIGVYSVVFHEEGGPSGPRTVIERIVNRERLDEYVAARSVEVVCGSG